MRNVFFHKGLKSEFDKKGYGVIDLLKAEQLVKLKSLYDYVEGAKGTANTNTYELSFFDFDVWSKPKMGANLRSVRFPIHKISEAELIQKRNQNLLAQEQVL